MTSKDIIGILSGVVKEGRDAIDEDTELLESGLLDSLGVILLMEALEERGVELQLTEVKREEFSTPARIAALTENL